MSIRALAAHLGLYSGQLRKGSLVSVSDWDSATNVAHYSQLAKELLCMAAEAKSAEARAQMVALAAQYEQLARHAIAEKARRAGKSTAFMFCLDSTPEST